jgi:metallophosphoesterase (TIGR00282 family)
MRVLFIGDIFASPGRSVIRDHLPDFINRNKIDFCIANGENASGGNGLSMAAADNLLACGVNFFTLGNHTWGNKEIMNFIGDFPIVRPANYSDDLPGHGSAVVETEKGKIGILNLQGRLYMESLDNPFKIGMNEVLSMREETNTIVVDFHCEATSEKTAMAYYLDGLVSCVIGTHTHVQTADERILPGGTAFITDVGMTGAREGIIGVEAKGALDRFVHNFPARTEPAKGPVMLNAVIVDTDFETGRARAIERVNLHF